MGNKPSRQQESKNDDFMLIYSQLINMGFSDELSLTASQKYPNSVDKAITWITKHSSNIHISTSHQTETTFNTPKRLRCNNCTVKTCLALQHIKKVLQIYDEWLYHKQNKNKNFITYILSTSLNNCSINNIWSDYQHIKYKQYNQSLTCCQSSIDCIPLQRHKRDNNNGYKIQYFDCDIPQIITLRMLDQIHLFMYHKIIHRITGTMHRKSRFCTIVKQHDNEYKNETKHNMDSDDNNMKQSEQISGNDFRQSNQNILEKDSYNFGQQFFYWPYFKNEKWFVSSKYDNFKQEITQNDMCKINDFSWNVEYENALEKLQDDDRIKQLVSNNEFRNEYQIKGGEPISLNHLLSILFYTDLSELPLKK
eukprot:215093_1